MSLISLLGDLGAASDRCAFPVGPQTKTTLHAKGFEKRGAAMVRVGQRKGSRVALEEDATDATDPEAPMPPSFVACKAATASANQAAKEAAMSPSELVQLVIARATESARAAAAVAEREAAEAKAARDAAWEGHFAKAQAVAADLGADLPQQRGRSSSLPTLRPIRRRIAFGPMRRVAPAEGESAASSREASPHPAFLSRRRPSIPSAASSRDTSPQGARLSRRRPSVPDASSSGEGAPQGARLTRRRPSVPSLLPEGYLTRRRPSVPTVPELDATPAQQEMAIGTTPGLFRRLDQKEQWRLWAEGLAPTPRSRPPSPPRPPTPPVPLATLQRRNSDLLAGLMAG